MKKFDIVVVGGGSGLMVAEAALQKGKTCALIEKAKFGGTCLTKGCIPSKMLVYPADVIREAQKAGRIGLDFEPPRADWQKISKRLWQQIDFHKEIEKSFMRLDGLTVYKGSAEFTGKKTLRVKGHDGSYSQEFEGAIIVIAAGAHSFVPPIKNLEQTGYLTSESFFGDKYPEKPWDSLVILGGGAIGAEFAHIFSAFGTKVTLIDRNSRIIKTEEAEVSAFVEAELQAGGVEVLTSCDVISSGRSGNKKHITLENNRSRERQVIEAEEIFIASGIRSNSGSLHLENTDIETDAASWIKTNALLETSQKDVYAIGDINGLYQFRHKANYEAEILINNLFGGEAKKSACYSAVPWAIFTNPQVAHLGMTEAQAKERGKPYWVGKNQYSQIAGGIAMGISERSPDNGFVKIIIGEEKTILGAHIVGPYASMLVQPFVYLMNSKHRCGPKDGKKADSLICPPVGSYAPIHDSMVIHPSFNELTAWALDNVDWSKGS